ncbi:MAG: GFA family protein [Glaciimonas sp.]|nr:GFA family protein [Glaciimonas sp.]
MVYGSCLCGRVKYQVTGDIRSASHCHCTMCQKQHGAACGSYANVDRAGFSYASGADAVAAYESSPGVTRGFCQICGSSLTWHSEKSPDCIAVSLGTLDAPYLGAVEDIFTETRVGWLPES